MTFKASARKAVADDGDFYPTPDFVTRALLAEKSFIGGIWEPACGDGRMSKVLKSTGLPVCSTDLYDRGYGESGIDFLDCDIASMNIVTNPPFKLAEEFVMQGLEKAENKLCLLLRLSFLEGQRRFNNIFSRTPPTKVLVISNRITFYPNGVQTAGSETLAHGWFIWDKSCDSGDTMVKWSKPVSKGER